MSKKKVLLTGSTGFIGKNIIEQIGNKYEFHTPSHSELNLLNQYSVDKFFIKNKYDVFINCALIGGSRSEEYVQGMLSDNLKMFFNIIRNKSSYKKLIHFGSGAEYDKSRPLIKIKEEDFDKKIPNDEYGFFKYICSKYIENCENVINLRIFGLFGKYEDYRYRFVSNAICRAINGLPIIMNQNVYFDYVYIDDFVKIVEYFLNNKYLYKFYNIGSGNKIDLLMIANKIKKLSKSKLKIKIINKGLNNEYTCNNAVLTKEIKGLKFTDIDNALLDLYNWYKDNKPVQYKI